MAGLLGDIRMLPSTADEEWNSSKRPYSTVANLEHFVNLYAEVSTLFLVRFGSITLKLRPIGGSTRFRPLGTWMLCALDPRALNHADTS